MDLLVLPDAYSRIPPLSALHKYSYTYSHRLWLSLMYDVTSFALCMTSSPYLDYNIVTPAIRIRQRPGHPGSPDVLSANGSLHFGRYSEACNGRVERFLCQVQI